MTLVMANFCLEQAKRCRENSEKAASTHLKKVWHQAEARWLRAEAEWVRRFGMAQPVEAGAELHDWDLREDTESDDNGALQLVRGSTGLDPEGFGKWFEKFRFN